jgi:hypothetical protein
MITLYTGQVMGGCRLTHPQWDFGSIFHLLKPPQLLFAASSAGYSSSIAVNTALTSNHYHGTCHETQSSREAQTLPKSRPDSGGKQEKFRRCGGLGLQGCSSGAYLQWAMESGTWNTNIRRCYAFAAVVIGEQNPSQKVRKTVKPETQYQRSTCIS